MSDHESSLEVSCISGVVPTRSGSIQANYWLTQRRQWWSLIFFFGVRKPCLGLSGRPPGDVQGSRNVLRKRVPTFCCIWPKIRLCAFRWGDIQAPCHLSGGRCLHLWCPAESKGRQGEAIWAIKRKKKSLNNTTFTTKCWTPHLTKLPASNSNIWTKSPACLDKNKRYLPMKQEGKRLSFPIVWKPRYSKARKALRQRDQYSWSTFPRL